MASFVFNIAKGRVAELYNRVDTNDPANSVLVVVAITSTALDSTLIDKETLAAVIADPNTAEVTNVGYARIVLTDAELAAMAADHPNDQMLLDIPDPVWAAVTAGDQWTDILICFDPDSTGGTDADIIPLTLHDFIAIPDGTQITVQIPATGFYRSY